MSPELAPEASESNGGAWLLWAVRRVFWVVIWRFGQRDWMSFFNMKALVWEVRGRNVI